MTSLVNDLKNFSNEIPRGSCERPKTTNPLESLDSEQTLSSMKWTMLKACFDMALNREEQVSASDFDLFTRDLKKDDILSSFVDTVTVLDFWPGRGQTVSLQVVISVDF